ncbi:MAG: GNAT family N-acetyltransferase [Elusimicrobia bacterium]|nr:GNAT family N-acetyltransferase [Elusimicrobiota bacterium]
MKVREAAPGERDACRELYRRTGYAGGVAPKDLVLAAFEGERLVGAVRLCREFGVVVLRGMQVLEEHRRQGVGTLLLRACEERLQGSVCWCVPYRHLEGFYGQAGFVVADGAPQGLVERLGRYDAEGLDVVLMRRPAPR